MDKIVVIKLGSKVFDLDNTLPDTILKDLLRLQSEGYRLVLVHGDGNPGNALSKKSNFSNGLTITSPLALQALLMMEQGQINSALVTSFNQAVLANQEAEPKLAVGLTGPTGILFEAIKIPFRHGIEIAGQITKVNLDSLLPILERGYIPVIAPVARAMNDADTAIFNLDADNAAAHLAAALEADTLVFLSDTPGVLDKDKKTIKVLSSNNSRERIADGTISGGMLTKVEAAFQALEGASRVVILDGREPDALYEAVAEYRYVGTTFLSRLGMHMYLTDLPPLDAHRPFDFMPTPPDPQLVGRAAYRAYVGTIDGYGTEAQNIQEMVETLSGRWGKYMGEASFAAFSIDQQGQAQIVGATVVAASEPAGIPDIINLFVVPEYRGKRVGYNLLVHTLHTLRDLGYQEAAISVAKGNQPAFKLYSGVGFTLKTK